MKNIFTFCFFWAVLSIQSQVISGKIVSKEEQLPIPFAKITVEDQNFGAITDKEGNFKIDLTSIPKGGQIKINVPGYEVYRQPLKDFISSDTKSIYLKEKFNAIEEVVITNQYIQKKNWGNNSKNKNILIGHDPSKNENDRSKEVALKFKNKRKLKIEKIHLNIARFDAKSPVFVRFNVYDAQMNSIVTEDVFDEIWTDKIIDDTYTLDVSKYNIWAKGEFFVSLQILNYFEGSIYLSGSLMGQKALYRNFNEDWKDVPVVSIALNIDAKVQKGKKGEIEETEISTEDDSALAKLIPDLTLYNEVSKKSTYGKNEAVGKYLNLSDAQIYYETYGEGEPIFLLHGNSGSIDAFYQQIPELAKNYKVIAMDTRAQGKSKDLSNKDFSYKIFAEDVMKLANELKLDKINIVGWSDGGNTGLEFALKYPNHLNKLITIGANAFPEGVVDLIGLGMKNELKNMKQENNPEKITQLRLLQLMVNEPQMIPSDLKKIKSPVLVIAGEHDVIKPTHTKMISENIPNAKLMIVENGTHFIPFQNPDLLNNAIKEFIK